MSSDTAIHRILVLCEGNHCRGPMAEALLRSLLPPEFSVESAGLHALEGHPADPEALLLMQRIGLDLSSHSGRLLTQEMTLAADLILVMDLAQKAWCEQMLPSTLGRVFLLGHWQAPSSQEIQDPFRQGPEAFRQAFDHVKRAVDDWPPRLIPVVRSA